MRRRGYRRRVCLLAICCPQFVALRLLASGGRAARRRPARLLLLLLRQTVRGNGDARPLGVATTQGREQVLSRLRAHVKGEGVLQINGRHPAAQHDGLGRDTVLVSRHLEPQLQRVRRAALVSSCACMPLREVCICVCYVSAGYTICVCYSAS